MPETPELIPIARLLALLPEESRLADVVRAQVPSSESGRPGAAVHPAARALLTRVLVAQAPLHLPTIRSGLFSTCEEAFIEHRVLRLAYVDGQGRTTERWVEPHGLLLRRSGWSL